MFLEARSATLGSLGLNYPSPGGGGGVFEPISEGGGSSGGGGIDWNQVIQSGFQFGTTVFNDRYAAQAAKYAGGYYPQGQGNETAAYQPITSTTAITPT